MTRQERYNFRKLHGICGVCGKRDAVPGQVRCEVCAESSKGNYYHYKSHGICVSCGEYSAVPGKTRCEVCEAKHTETSARRIERMTAEEKERYKKRCSETNKSKYYRRKNAGICVQCGKRQAENSKVKCSICLLKERERKREKRNEKNGIYISRAEFPSYGICYLCCKNPVLEGKKLCAGCYEKHLASLQIARASDAGIKSREQFRRTSNLFFMKQTSSL